ncbi:MAG: hypothetical protein JXK07_07145 [Spirochaetes bacterium]|nr:hypothetical protein [Spirochaetota bacterium]MBN2769629.1 hypothetical protein [Spirochaetota bacterium]
MKKILLFLTVLLTFLSCDDKSGSSADRQFWVADDTKDYYSSSAGWYQVPANLVYEGKHCEIYLEDDQDISESIIDNIASAFDNRIYDVVTNNFSTPTDIDTNKKVILLLLDIKDGYSGPGDGYIGGYFAPWDLFSESELAMLGFPSHYKSNECEILYIDINPADPTSEEIKSTIAHEFQHLVNMSQNVIYEDGYQMPTWIDEGFSMAAETIYQNVDLLEEREAWYDADPFFTGAIEGIPQDLSMSIAAGHPLVAWANDESVYNNYALSHLFFAWLRIHMLAKGDDDTFFKEIMADKDNTLDTVVEVCSSAIGTDINTNAKIIQRFYMANFLGGNGKTTGIESYLGKNRHEGPFTLTSEYNLQFPLLPGAAIHISDSAVNGWVPSGGDEEVIYALGDISSETADYIGTGGFGTGDNTQECLIVLNSLDEYTGEDSIKLTAPLPDSHITLNSVSGDNYLVLSDSPSNWSKLSKHRATTVEDLPKGTLRRGLEPKGDSTSRFRN